MATNETTTNYIDLSNKVYELALDAVAQAQKRFLEHTKNVCEISLRPYTASSPEAFAREHIERISQISSLAVSEAQTAGQKNRETAQKASELIQKALDSATNTQRGLWNTSLSNLNYVKETTNAQLDTFAKRVDEIQTRAAAATAGTASKN